MFVDQEQRKRVERSIRLFATIEESRVFVDNCSELWDLLDTLHIDNDFLGNGDYGLSHTRFLLGRQGWIRYSSPRYIRLSQRQWDTSPVGQWVSRLLWSSSGSVGTWHPSSPSQSRPSWLGVPPEHSLRLPTFKMNRNIKSVCTFHSWAHTVDCSCSIA